MGLQFFQPTNVSLHRKNQNPRIMTKYTTQLNKTGNGYLIVQAALSKFTAEIQNAIPSTKKLTCLRVVYLVVNDGSK